MNLKLKYSEKLGYGLFAKKSYKKGEVVYNIKGKEAIMRTVQAECNKKLK